MTSLNHRLQKKKEIDLVFKKGKSFREGLLVLKVLRKESGTYRIAFIISQKVSKRANIRNKLRRRLKSIIEELLGKEKNVSKDILLIAMPGLEKMEYEELRNLMKKCLRI